MLIRKVVEKRSLIMKVSIVMYFVAAMLFSLVLGYLTGVACDAMGISRNWGLIVLVINSLSWAYFSKYAE